MADAKKESCTGLGLLSVHLKPGGRGREAYKENYSTAGKFQRNPAGQEQCWDQAGSHSWKRGFRATSSLEKVHLLARASASFLPESQSHTPGKRKSCGRADAPYWLWNEWGRACQWGREGEKQGARE